MAHAEPAHLSGLGRLLFPGLLFKDVSKGCNPRMQPSFWRLQIGPSTPNRWTPVEPFQGGRGRHL